MTTAEPSTPMPSRWRARLERLPTLVYLAAAALVVIGVVALVGGFADAQPTYAEAEMNVPVDVGVAEVTVDSVRLHPTDYYGNTGDGAEFLTIRLTITNTTDVTLMVSTLLTTGTVADAAYGVKAVAIDEDIELGYLSIRTAAGESSSLLGPQLTQTYDVTASVAERVANRESLTLQFAPMKYTPNQFLRDTSDGYYLTLDATARGEFAISDESSAP